MSEFRMPSLGADMDAGTLVEWRVKPGDAVKRGDIVALVETQKGIVEVEIWETGVVESVVVSPGTKVPVGTVLAMLRGDLADQVPRATATTPQVLAQPQAQPAPTRATDGEQGVRVQASPAARKLARERGVDLAAVHGTGPHGTITLADIEHAGEASQSSARPEPPAEAVSPAPVAAMRDAIAAAMARSKREIPHYYLGSDIDVSRAVAWLETENANRAVTERALFASVLLRATALAIREVPDVNGFFTDKTFRPSNAIHIGVAVMLRPGGLVAPAIHDVDQKSVWQIMANLRDLVGRARRGTLRSSELADPTITVTNLGEQSVSTVFGVIYPPQVALVGFGKVAMRPWAEGGMLGVRSVLTATLAADHRVSDGHRGAVFLSALGRLLSEPEKL